MAGSHSVLDLEKFLGGGLKSCLANAISLHVKVMQDVRVRLDGAGDCVLCGEVANPDFMDRGWCANPICNGCARWVGRTASVNGRSSPNETDLAEVAIRMLERHVSGRNPFPYHHMKWKRYRGCNGQPVSAGKT